MTKRLVRLATILALLSYLSFQSSEGSNKEPPAADPASRLKRHIEALAAIGPRPAGSLNESRAADYIVGQFEAMGLPAVIEPFPFEAFEPSGISLTIGGEDFAPVGLGIDPYGGILDYAGPFVVLEPRSPSSWPSPPSLKGQAVVTSESGDAALHFRIAALGPRVIIDLAPDDLDRARKLTGRKLSLSVQGRMAAGISRNVVARLGSAPAGARIIVGAHMDAYRECPGANDNASGVAALLELARDIKSDGAPAGKSVAFVAFGAEEVGILGSRQFVERHAEELKSCRLALILDNLGGAGPVLVERNGGLAEPAHDPGVGTIPKPYRGRAWEGLRFPWRLLPSPTLFDILGSTYHPEELKSSIDSVAKKLDFPVQFTGMQGSDQLAFAQAGIATSGVSSPNGRSHTLEDKPGTVDLEKVRQCFVAAERIVQKLSAGLTFGDEPEEKKTRAALAAHVRFLASDELRGRKAGSPEGDIAARYIAERLRAAGVEAFPEAPGYFQDMAWRRKEDPARSQDRPVVRARNVVGFIHGRDAYRAAEYILLMAHYDHLGVRRVNGAERVFNGARDNAMGVAVLIEAAAELAAFPPARSILLLATTAEEEGMIGSRFFAEHPLIPLARIAFVLNNDGAGMYEPGLWCIGGLERTTAGPLAEAAGRAHGLATVPYPEKYRYLFAEGDSIAFVDKGIPSLTVSPGFTAGQEERIRGYVHTPADRVDEAFDEAYLVKFCRAYASLARAFAETEAVPRVKTASFPPLVRPQEGPFAGR